MELRQQFNYISALCYLTLFQRPYPRVHSCGLMARQKETAYMSLRRASSVFPISHGGGAHPAASKKFSTVKVIFSKSHAGRLESRPAVTFTVFAATHVWNVLFMSVMRRASIGCTSASASTRPCRSGRQNRPSIMKAQISAASDKKKRKIRNAIELIIGHLKRDYGLAEDYLKRRIGGEINSL